MQYPFRNLIFEGGGVKGIAYVGALKELETRGITQNIVRVGGTSAGAINAVLLALGYSLDETKQILWDLDFNKFMDDSWGIVRDTKRLIDEFGWYTGDFFRSWVGKIIRQKTGNEHSTFNDLRNRGFLDLYVVATNVSTKFSEVLSAEHTPRQCVADAVRMSMSIPLFFKAIRNPRGDVYVDGGVFNNYPVKLFDRLKYVEEADRAKHAREPEYYAEENKKIHATSSPYVFNKETLGFRLDTGSQIAVFRDGAEPPREKIDDFFDYAWALIRSVVGAQDDRHLHSDDWQRTVYVDTIDVGTTDFDLSNAKKDELVQEGTKGVRKYFEWYDNVPPEELPANHPDYDKEPVTVV